MASQPRSLLALASLTCALVLILAAPAAALPDNRGWELVSPIDKNGGGVAPPAEAGAGTTRAAAQGGAIAFASKASFANGAGASPYSQYIARRTSTGWVTENITPAQLAGAYVGSPYLAFSADLGKALMLKPSRSVDCDPCPPGYLVRDNDTGQIVEELDDPAEFEGTPPSPPAVPPGASFLAADSTGQTVYYRIDNTIWRAKGGTETQIITAFGTGVLADTAPITSGASSDGERIFFTTAAKLVNSDVNLAPDAYQWQAQGKGSCAKAGGCIDLISSGLAGTSTFVAASASGEEAFFITDRSLVPQDTSAVDLYVAKVGGGFPVPTEPPLCIGDACQVVPPAPEDPVLTTVLSGPGNPKERYQTYGSAKRCPKGKRARVVRTRRGKRVRRCLTPKQIRAIKRRAVKRKRVAKRRAAAHKRGRR